MKQLPNGTAVVCTIDALARALEMHQTKDGDFRYLVQDGDDAHLANPREFAEALWRWIEGRDDE